MDVDSLVISVQIPDGAEPGDSLSFHANGQDFTIEVPIASVAGDVLQIELANPDCEKNIASEDSRMEVENNDDGKITTEMVTGSRITIVQNLGAKSSLQNFSDGTHQMVWPASRFIVKFINTPDFCRKILNSSVNSVLELGAGHGLLGMAFADVASKFDSRDEAMKLILTDVEAALPQLEANIRSNQGVLGKDIDVSALPLKWHSQPMSRTNSNFDFILGSDLLYNCSAIPDLVATIRRLVFKKILLSVRWRKPSEERSFFVLLSDIIDWKLVHGDCSLDYRNYGNGSYESNKFFSQTMVSIKGEIVTLSSVDERNCEHMNTKEFERYEELQTQIYLGIVRQQRINTDHVDKRPKVDT